MASALNYIEALQAKGQYHFSSDDAVRALGGNRSATRAALRRLKAKGVVAVPHRSFYVIVPPEYRSSGCLPADQFLPALMDHLEEHYYVTLLSAAAYHDAAHQRPQAFQVMLQERRRAIACGETHVQFLARADMEATTVVERNTQRGVIRIASPEATALELVGYANQSGGLNNVATVLAELAEGIDGAALAAEARRSPLSWVQRLGHLLVVVKADELASSLDPVVSEARAFPIALVPSVPSRGVPSDPRWKVAVNVPVEPDL